jgi:hypothetical protein
MNQQIKQDTEFVGTFGFPKCGFNQEPGKAPIQIIIKRENTNYSGSGPSKANNSPYATFYKKPFPDHSTIPMLRRRKSDDC